MKESLINRLSQGELLELWALTQGEQNNHLKEELYQLTLAQSYAYLRRFKGIDFLIDCYAAEHTLSIEDAVEDIMLLCQKNGGRVGC